MPVPRDFARTRIVRCFTGSLGCLFQINFAASTISNDVDSVERANFIDSKSKLSGARTVSETVSPIFITLRGGIIVREKLLPSSSEEVGSSPASASSRISCNVFANTWLSASNLFRSLSPSLRCAPSSSAIASKRGFRTFSTSDPSARKYG